MRAKAEITIACFCALFLPLCAGSGLQAQSAPPPAQPAGNQDSANELSVAVGKTVLVDLARPISRVAIGIGDIAETHAISPTEIMVNGKTPGETSLIVWDTTGGRQFFNVSVRASSSLSNDSLEAVRRELRTELPGQALKVSSESGMIFLRGTVKDFNSSQRAVQIAATAGKVVNLLYVDVPEAEQQVLLKVRFASVDRSLAKSLGINIFSTGLLNTTGNISTGQFSPPTITAGAVGTAPTATFSNQLNILALTPGNLPFGVDIEALESRGVVQLLAEPNILAVNNKEASFLAGGEYPYPVAQASAGGAAAITIQFKEYGIRLNFIPTFTPRGTIRLQIAPEVSSLDFADAVDIGGFNVPAITSRKMKTEVELGDGQSFVLAGLLDNTESETFMKIPFLGDIPILGKFFQSMQKNKANTELIVIVTPEIVSPIPAGSPTPELKYPGKWLPTNSGIPMNTPDAKTAANTPAPPTPTIPIEKLIDSMKPEPQLIIEGGTSFGAGSSGAGGATGGGTPTAPTTAPQQ